MHRMQAWAKTAAWAGVVAWCYVNCGSGAFIRWVLLECSMVTAVAFRWFINRATIAGALFTRIDHAADPAGCTSRDHSASGNSVDIVAVRRVNAGVWSPMRQRWLTHSKSADPYSRSSPDGVQVLGISFSVPFRSSRRMPSPPAVVPKPTGRVAGKQWVLRRWLCCQSFRTKVLVRC